MTGEAMSAGDYLRGKPRNLDSPVPLTADGLREMAESAIADFGDPSGASHRDAFWDFGRWARRAEYREPRLAQAYIDALATIAARDAALEKCMAALRRVPIIERGSKDDPGFMRCKGCGAESRSPGNKRGECSEDCKPNCWVAQLEAALAPAGAGKP